MLVPDPHQVKLPPDISDLCFSQTDGKRSDPNVLPSRSYLLLSCAACCSACIRLYTNIHSWTVPSLRHRSLALLSPEHQPWLTDTALEASSAIWATRPLRRQVDLDNISRSNLSHLRLSLWLPRRRFVYGACWD